MHLNLTLTIDYHKSGVFSMLLGEISSMGLACKKVQFSVNAPHQQKGEELMMKKRCLSILLVLCMVMTLLPTVAFAAEIVASGTCGSNLRWSLDSEGTLTISGTGDMARYSNVGSGGYDQNAPWKGYGDNIYKLVVEEGVTSISGDAFLYCNNITDVTIPSTLKTIGSCVFGNADAITSVRISDIKAWCNLSFPTFYGGQMSNPISNADLYLNGELVTELVIPDGITEIKDYAFYECKSLTSIIIPEGVTSIGDRAFYNCVNLSDITIPVSVSSIGDDAFWNCSSECNVRISDLEQWCGLEFTEGSVPLSDYSHFYINDELITELEIPDTVTDIGDYAFYGCCDLTSVKIPSGVKAIGVCSFSNCRNLSSVSIPATVVSIGDDAFDNCSGLARVDISSLSDWFNIKFASRYSNPLFCAHNLYLDDELVTHLSIPDGISSIGDYTFIGSTCLQSMNVPKSVTSVGTDAFSFCSGLERIDISDIGAWCMIDFKSNGSNPLFYAHNLYLDDNLLTQIQVPNGITAIKDFAFHGGSYLTSVLLPESICSIGNYAFSGCTELT